MVDDGTGRDEISGSTGSNRVGNAQKEEETEEAPDDRSIGDEQLHTDEDGDTSVCSRCGAQIGANTNICPECAIEQPGSDRNSGDIPRKSRLTAALLAIALGIFGAHKFYLGNVKIGLLYLVMAPTAIPAIIGVIEGIIYLTKSQEEFQRQYVN